MIGGWIANWLVTHLLAAGGMERLGDLEIWIYVFGLALCASGFWSSVGILLKSNVSITLASNAIQLRNGTSLDLSINWQDVKEIKPVFVRTMHGDNFFSIDIHLKEHRSNIPDILEGSHSKRAAAQAPTPSSLFPNQVGIMLDSLTVSADELYQLFQKHVDAYNNALGADQSGVTPTELSVTESVNNSAKTQPNDDEICSQIDITELPEQRLYLFVELPYRLALAIDFVFALTLIIGLMLVFLDGYWGLDYLVSPAAFQISGYVSLVLIPLFILQTINTWPAQTNRRSRNLIHQIFFKAHGMNRLGWYGKSIHLLIIAFVLYMAIDEIIQQTCHLLSCSA